MEVKSNGTIREIHADMMESMTRLVRNQEDAFSIIWFDIHGCLEPTHPAMKADLCGILTAKVIGKNIGSRVYVPIQDNTSYYQMIQAKYAFGKTVNELGEYWKELMGEEKSFRLRGLLRCLDIYYREIMPFVKNEIEIWWVKACHKDPELSPTLRPYREHRTKIRATMRIIETALDIFTLLHKAENDHEVT